jgi:hypothetical protein
MALVVFSIAGKVNCVEGDDSKYQNLFISMRATG